jgi:hypothetical protein
MCVPMMPLYLMSEMLKTVDSKWRSSLVESMLERWTPDQNTIYYLRSSANTVFIFRSATKPHYFRINASTERTLNELEAEMAILNDLHERGIPVAKPIPSLLNRYVETFDTEITNLYGVVFEGIEGESGPLIPSMYKKSKPGEDPWENFMKHGNMCIRPMNERVWKTTCE